jgi:hypothetical protein
MQAPSEPSASVPACATVEDALASVISDARKEMAAIALDGNTRPFTRVDDETTAKRILNDHDTFIFDW